MAKGPVPQWKPTWWARYHAPMLGTETHFGWQSATSRLWVMDGLAAGDEGWDDWLVRGDFHLESSASILDQVVGVGRHPARKVLIGGKQGVWRINRHGGALGSMLGDKYLTSHRLGREIRLSQELRHHGVATPEVLLGLALREGLFWRQHLVTAEVEFCRTVFDSRKDRNALGAADALLDRLADLGLWATDLHPDNMLWQKSSQTCWVIDLAGARLLGRPLKPVERESIRARFVRYFKKHAGRVPTRFDAD